MPYATGTGCISSPVFREISRIREFTPHIKGKPDCFRHNSPVIVMAENLTKRK